MGLLRYVGVAMVALGVAFAACSEESETHNGTGTPAGTTNTGVGGSGGTPVTTGGAGGQEWITCGEPHTNLEGECDLINQDCPPGQWCDVFGSDDTATVICKPHFGGLFQAGDECEQTSQCDVGMRCLSEGHCAPYCCPDSDIPCAGGRCDVHVDRGGGKFAMMCSYNPKCELFLDDCEDIDGEIYDCHIAAAGEGLAVCDQRSLNWVDEGGPCHYRNDCGDSQFCNSNPPDVDPDAGVEGRCRYLCLVSDWQNQPPGFGGCPQTPDPQTCHDAGLPAFPDVGVCIPD